MRKSTCRVFLVLVFLCGSLSALFADIKNLNCQFSNDLIMISWQTDTETDVEGYVVQKSGDGSSFSDLVKVNPKGNYSRYTIIDKDLFKSYNFFYRVMTIKKDNSVVYTESKDVKISASAVSTTWGSLKAMFR